MAWDDNSNGIGSIGGTNRARSTGTTDCASNFSITARFPIWDATEFLPYQYLKRGPSQVQLAGKLDLFSREIALQLVHSLLQSRYLLATHHPFNLHPVFCPEKALIHCCTGSTRPAYPILCSHHNTLSTRTGNATPI